LAEPAADEAKMLDEQTHVPPLDSLELDQNIEAARSATLHELAALVRHELQRDRVRGLVSLRSLGFAP
jgi:hypothetical protein